MATLSESLTYDQLVAKIQAGTLNKNGFYTITDFATVHWMVDNNGNYVLDGEGEKIIHTGANEPITVMATSANTLAPEAWSLTHPTDVLKYDWNALNYPDIKQFWDADNFAFPVGFKGIITRREDVTKAIKTNFDFREITYRLWSIEQAAWEEQEYDQNDVVQVGNVLYAAKEVIADVAQVSTVTLTGTAGTANITEAGGLTKLVTFGDDLADSAADFVTSFAADYLAEDIIVTANGADIIFTSNIPGTAFTVPVITNVSDDLSGTVVETTDNYSVSTSPDESDKWQYLIDITGNVFLSYGNLYVVNYGVTIQDADDYIDRTMFEDDTCNNIVFDECNYIPFVTYGSYCGFMTYGSGCGFMTYGSECNTMTYGSGCGFMTYGSECNTMTYGSYCGSMTYGSGCGFMTYGSYCGSMTYGSECNTMTYGSGCGSMTYGSECNTMTYGSYCGSMTYGSGCGFMTYGSYCGFMTYGSECNTMTYGSGCGSMTYPDYTVRNDFKDGVGDIDFTVEGITQITDGTTVTHSYSGAQVYQSYIDSSETPTLVITTNTIGIYQE